MCAHGEGCGTPYAEDAAAAGLGAAGERNDAADVCERSSGAHWAREGAGGGAGEARCDDACGGWRESPP